MKFQILTAALASVAAANTGLPSFWPTEGLEHLNSEDGFTMTMYENMKTELSAGGKSTYLCNPTQLHASLLTTS